MLECLTKKHLGVDCPGCGLQRSVLSLFEGNFVDSFIYYPGLLPLLVGICCSFLFIWRKADLFIVIAKASYIIAGVVILGNWILKLTGVIPCPV